MKIEVSEQPLTDLEDYADISIAFEVDRVFDIAGASDNPGEFVLTERSLDAPFVKNYDAFAGESPSEWSSRFDVSNWGLLAAQVEGQRVGGAVVAFATPGLMMLEDRNDLAVLWDIRVSPVVRRQGIGVALLQAAAAWAKARGCRELKVETQNINVAACKFYAQQGFMLTAVDRLAYPELPNEIRMLWYKRL